MGDSAAPLGKWRIKSASPMPTGKDTANHGNLGEGNGECVCLQGSDLQLYKLCPEQPKGNGAEAQLYLPSLCLTVWLHGQEEEAAFLFNPHLRICFFN